MPTESNANPSLAMWEAYQSRQRASRARHAEEIRVPLGMEDARQAIADAIYAPVADLPIDVERDYDGTSYSVANPTYRADELAAIAIRTLLDEGYTITPPAGDTGAAGGQ